MPLISRSTSVESTAVLSFQLVSKCVPVQPLIVRELRELIRHIYAVQPAISNVSQFIYFCKTFTCFRRFFRPSSAAQSCTYRPKLLPAADLARLAAGASLRFKFLPISFSSLHEFVPSTSVNRSLQLHLC